MQPSLPTGTVSFLFTDIEDSTGLAQQYPTELPSLLAQHHAILRQSIETNSGYIFLIVGDAFCAAFPTATDVLAAALEAQRRLQQAAWYPVALKVRMGIHTGPAQAGSIEDVTGVYTGYLTLTRAQRVMSMAHGGQVLISGASAELLRGELPEGVELRDMGEHRLKGLLNPEHLWQMTAGDLIDEFPVLKSLNAIPTNLPVQLDSFIGREHELSQTKQFLTTTHLLTLIGPGGTGKTRLTLQLAAEVLPEFTDGVWLVELAPLAEPALVLQTVATTLGVRELPGKLLKDLLIDYLRSKHLLLILDNCEHLVEACATLAELLLRSSPNLKVVASSREALGVTGETIFRVPPLSLPDSDRPDLEAMRHSEAVQLFVARATAVKSDFALTGQNGQAVAQICQRLDGIPLALELAAGRVGMFTPQQIAQRLDDRFRLLTGGSRTALPRQQTLRSLIDWSYDLLSEPESLLFRRLAVFVGGWSLEAAEAICPELDVFEHLTQLVQKSLVVVEEREKPAATRFRMLETIRQYARDRLIELEAAAQVRDRHLAYYLNLAETAEPHFFGPQRLEWIDRCELEHDNFRAALQWGLEYDIDAALRLGGALATFWTSRSFIQEGRRWLRAALERSAALPDPHGEAGHQRQVAKAKGLIGDSNISYGDGDYHTGLDASQEAVRLYRQLGDPFGLAFALNYTGNMAAFLGEIELAEGALLEAVRVGREIENKMILSFALGVLSHYVDLPRGDITAARAHNDESARFAREIGLIWAEAQNALVQVRIAASLGQWDEARAHAQAALVVAGELRDPFLEDLAYKELADVELLAGNLPEAQRIHQQCIVNLQQMGQRPFVIHELESFAFLAHRQDQPRRAVVLLGVAEALREELGVSPIGIERLEDEYERAVGGLRSQLNEATYRSYWSEGETMTLDQAVTFALQE